MFKISVVSRILQWLAFAIALCSPLAHTQEPNLTSIELSGQWYDRTHSGHGLDLNQAGNTVFGTFYSYDGSGKAEWLWLQLPQGAQLSGDLTRFRKIGTNPPVQERAGQFSLRAVSACADALPRPGVRSLLEFKFSLPQGQQSWCLEPLLPDTALPERALDGHWYAPSSDSGWGLVTHFYPVPQASGTPQAWGFHTLYFYDDAGLPRWAVANFPASSFEQRIDFFTLQGSCFGCATSNYSPAPIGSAELKLRTALPLAGGLAVEPNSIDLQLRFENSSNFTRRAPLRLLSAPTTQLLVRSTAQGIVQGVAVSETIERYSNIPFAASPVGDRRLRAPQPAALRKQTLNATLVGPGCVQPVGQALFATAPPTQSEDCLQLNVWRPRASSGSLPVMVWIHGGGLTIGSAVEQVNSRLVYDGQQLAEKGVLVVSINYRLGVFGYLGLRALQGEADQSANLGLLDQISALRWVQDNIAAFGGDPSQVTIFGESAGGVSACALMASPLARGLTISGALGPRLFSRAIAQSGNCLTTPKTLEAALAQGDRVLGNLGCALSSPEAIRSCVRNASADALLSASQARVNLGLTSSGENYGLIVDGVSLSESPASAIASGRAAQIPFMLGVNDDESTSTTPASSLPATEAGYVAQIRQQFGVIADLVLARYPLSGYSSPARAYQDLLDDVRFNCANRRAAADHSARGNTVFHYVLTDFLPDPQLAPLESFHGLDISYVFGRNGGAASERNLREKIQLAWTNFAKSAEPMQALGYPWPRYDSTRASADLNSAATTTLTDYHGDQCVFWARYVAL